MVPPSIHRITGTLKTCLNRPAVFSTWQSIIPCIRCSIRSHTSGRRESRGQRRANAIDQDTAPVLARRLAAQSSE